MTGEIRIDYAAVFSQVGELRSRLRAGIADAESSFNQAQAALMRMDGQTNAELQAVLTQARRKAEVTGEVVERLLDTIHESAMQMELKEARLAARFNVGMRSDFGVSNMSGSSSAPGAFSSASMAAGRSIANSLNLAGNLTMAGLGNVAVGRVVGSASSTFNNSISGLANLNTGAAIGSVSMSLSGGFTGLNAMETPAFAGGALAGISGGASLHGANGFSNIGLDVGAQNLDMLALTGAGAVGRVSGSGIGMSGIGMAGVGLNAGGLSQLNGIGAFHNTGARLSESRVSSIVQEISSGNMSALNGASSPQFALGGFGNFSGMGMLGSGASSSLAALNGAGMIGAGAMGSFRTFIGQQSGISASSGTAAGAGNIRAAYTATSFSVQQFGQAAQGASSSQVTRTIDWSRVRSILDLPADRITEEQFAELANLFVSLDSVEDLQLFLNYLADKVETDADNVSGRDFQWPNYTAFTICPDKAAGIQRHVDVAMAILLHSQFQLMMDGDSFSNDHALTVQQRRRHIETINNQRHHLMGRIALLTVVSDLAAHTQHSSRWPDGVTLRNVLAASEGMVGPFTLAAIDASNNPGLPFEAGFSLSFQHALLRLSNPRQSGVGYTNALFSRDNSIGVNGGRTIHISSALDTRCFGNSVLRLEGMRLKLKHQFDATAHIFSEITKKIRSAAIAAAWKVAVPFEGAMAILPGIDFVRGMPSARARAEAIQVNIASMVEVGFFSNYLIRFELDGVIISEAGINWDVLVWPTHLSYGSLLALNNIINTTRSNLLAQLDSLRGFQRQETVDRLSYLLESHGTLSWELQWEDPVLGPILERSQATTHEEDRLHNLLNNLRTFTWQELMMDPIRVWQVYELMERENFLGGFDPIRRQVRDSIPLAVIEALCDLSSTNNHSAPKDSDRILQETPTPRTPSVPHEHWFGE